MTDIVEISMAALGFRPNIDAKVFTGYFINRK